MVAEVVPDCEVAFAAGASADTRNYRVDFTKIETKLPGFEPTWTLRAGHRGAVRRRTREHGLTRQEWDGPRYYRLRTVRGLLERGALGNDLRPAALRPA